MRRRRSVLAASVLAGAMSSLVAAAPEERPAGFDWQLDFAFHDLQRLTLRLPGDSRPSTYWYLLYTVTNNTGRDVEFLPTFELVTDTLQVVVGGDNISPTVYDAIRARHKKAYPFFRDPIRTSGKLLQGEDNARTSVAVFQDFDTEASSVRIYVAGLSGATERRANPVFDSKQPESDANAQFFTLRKSLVIGYDLPGDPQTRHSSTPVRRLRDWVLR